MNTKTEIIGAAALAILVVLLTLWYMNEHPAPFVNSPDSSTATTTGQAASQGAQAIADSGAYYEATGKYPGATPLLIGNAEAVATMRQFELDAIAAFKEDAIQSSSNAPDMGIGEAGVEQAKQSLDINYRSVNSAHTVSYVFTLDADTLGAHPNAYFRTFTFDLRTGRNLALADLFTPGTAYLGRLSQLSRELLPAVIAKNSGTSVSDVDATTLAGGTAAQETSFKNWYLDGSNLVIVFEPYQVAAYAAGPQTLSIPLSRLAGSLKSDFK